MSKEGIERLKDPHRDGFGNCGGIEQDLVHGKLYHAMTELHQNTLCQEGGSVRKEMVFDAIMDKMIGTSVLESLVQ